MGSLYVCNSWTRWKDLPQGCHDCCPSIQRICWKSKQYSGLLVWQGERETHCRKPSNCQIYCKNSSVLWAPINASRCVATGRSLISQRTRAIFCFTQSFFSEGDPTLAAHLQTEAVSRVTYLSPQSQNEKIDVIGKHYIQKKLVKEILESKYYAILADEATSHNEEKLRHSLRRC